MVSASIFLKTSELRISNLGLADGWRSRLDVANIAGLAAEIRAGRVLPPIGVDRDHVVVYGFHRIAAHQAVGATTIRCDILDLEDGDAREEAMLCENLRRRVLSKEERDQALGRLVQLRQKRIQTQDADNPQLAENLPGAARDNPQSAENLPAPKTKPHSPRRQAIKQIAKEEKFSEDTVERAVKKLEAPTKNGASNGHAKEEVTPPEPTIRAFGLSIPADVQARLSRWEERFRRIDSALRTVALACGELEKDGLPDGQNLRIRYKEYAHVVRAARPAALCPYCKAVPEIRVECSSCHCTGITDEGAVSNWDRGGVTKELLAEGKAAVVPYNGKFVPVSKFTRGA